MKGHIYKRSKTSWTIMVDVGCSPVTGKRKQLSRAVRGKKKDAERELRAILTSLETGTYIKPTKLSVAEHLENWLNDYVATNTAPKTASGYRFIVRRYLTPYLGSITLTQLQPSNIQSCYSKILSCGLSARTALHAHRVLSEALNHAVRWQMLARNPACVVTPPRPTQRETKTLSEEQVRSFLEAAADSPFYDLFFLAIWTGMRRGELLGLRWQEVDLEMAQLSVNQTLQRIAGRLVIQSPKTAKSRRTIALPPTACILLRERRERQAIEKSQFGATLQGDDFVFAWRDGTPFGPDGITHAFSRIVAKAGLPHTRLHDLRHAHASFLIKQGIPAKVISERLGHSGISITMDTYGHLMPGMDGIAAQKFDEVFGR